MAYLALLWRARIIEQYRLKYEREKQNSIRIMNAHNPKQTLYEKLRNYNLQTKDKISKTLLRRYPKGSNVYNFCYYLKTDQTFPNFVMKSVIGFVGGMVLTYICFMFFVFQLSISLIHATIMSSIIGIMLTLGLAFSYRIRCLVFLLIPQFFSRVGRYTLTCYALVLILTGPATNTLKNSEVLTESLACGEAEIKNTIGLINLYVDKPFIAMKDNIRIMVDSVKQTTDKLKHVLLSLNRLVLSVARTLQSSSNWLYSLSETWNKKLGTPYQRCHDLVQNASLECIATLGLKHAVKNPAGLSKSICLPVSNLEVFCNPIESSNGNVYGAILRKLTSFNERLKSMLHIDVTVHHKYIFTSNATRSVNLIAAGIVTEIRNKADLFLTWLSWSSTVTSASLLLIVFRAKYYQHMYETRSRFDNRYITSELRNLDIKRYKQGRATVLPLNKREQGKYIKTTSLKLLPSEKTYISRSALAMAITTFKLIIHMVADYSLYWMLITMRRYGMGQTPLQPGMEGTSAFVSGSSVLSNFLQTFLRSISKPLMAQPNSPITCLPNPFPPDFRRYTQIGVLIFLLWFSALFEPYGLRLRHVVMGHYRPERAKARAIWLYNHIQRTRASFLKFARRKLHKEFKYRSEEKHTLRRWLDARIPCKRLKNLLGISPDEPHCLLCGEVEDDTIPLVRCETPSCPGSYCFQCFTDLGQLCTICLKPADYGDMSDVSLERGSSDDDDDDYKVPKGTKERNNAKDNPSSSYKENFDAPHSLVVERNVGSKTAVSRAKKEFRYYHMKNCELESLADSAFSKAFIIKHRKYAKIVLEKEFRHKVKTENHDIVCAVCDDGVISNKCNSKCQCSIEENEQQTLEFSYVEIEGKNIKNNTFKNETESVVYNIKNIEYHETNQNQSHTKQCLQKKVSNNTSVIWSEITLLNSYKSRKIYHGIKTRNNSVKRTRNGKNSILRNKDFSNISTDKRKRKYHIKLIFADSFNFKDKSISGVNYLPKDINEGSRTEIKKNKKSGKDTKKSKKLEEKDSNQLNITENENESLVKSVLGHTSFSYPTKPTKKIQAVFFHIFKPNSFPYLQPKPNHKRRKKNKTTLTGEQMTKKELKKIKKLEKKKNKAEKKNLKGKITKAYYENANIGDCENIRNYRIYTYLSEQDWKKSFCSEYSQPETVRDEITKEIFLTNSALEDQAYLQAYDYEDNNETIMEENTNDETPERDAMGDTYEKVIKDVNYDVHTDNSENYFVDSHKNQRKERVEEYSLDSEGDKVKVKKTTRAKLQDLLKLRKTEKQTKTKAPKRQGGRLKLIQRLSRGIPSLHNKIGKHKECVCKEKDTDVNQKNLHTYRVQTCAKDLHVQNIRNCPDNAHPLIITRGKCVRRNDPIQICNKENYQTLENSGKCPGKAGPVTKCTMGKCMKRQHRAQPCNQENGITVEKINCPDGPRRLVLPRGKCVKRNEPCTREYPGNQNICSKGKCIKRNVNTTDNEGTKSYGCHKCQKRNINLYSKTDDEVAETLLIRGNETVHQKCQKRNINVSNIDNDIEEALLVRPEPTCRKKCQKRNAKVINMKEDELAESLLVGGPDALHRQRCQKRNLNMMNITEDEMAEAILVDSPDALRCQKCQERNVNMFNINDQQAETSATHRTGGCQCKKFGPQTRCTRKPVTSRTPNTECVIVERSPKTGNLLLTVKNPLCVTIEQGPEANMLGIKKACAGIGSYLKYACENCKRVQDETRNELVMVRSVSATHIEEEQETQNGNSKHTKRTSDSIVRSTSLESTQVYERSTQHKKKSRNVSTYFKCRSPIIVSTESNRKPVPAKNRNLEIIYGLQSKPFNDSIIEIYPKTFENKSKINKPTRRSIVPARVDEYVYMEYKDQFTGNLSQDLKNDEIPDFKSNNKHYANEDLNKTVNDVNVPEKRLKSPKEEKNLTSHGLNTYSKKREDLKNESTMISPSVNGKEVLRDFVLYLKKVLNNIGAQCEVLMKEKFPEEKNLELPHNNLTETKESEKVYDSVDSADSPDEVKVNEKGFNLTSVKSFESSTRRALARAWQKVSFDNMSISTLKKSLFGYKNAGPPIPKSSIFSDISENESLPVTSLYSVTMYSDEPKRRVHKSKPLNINMFTKELPRKTKPSNTNQTCDASTSDWWSPIIDRKYKNRTRSLKKKKGMSDIPRPLEESKKDVGVITEDRKTGCLNKRHESPKMQRCNDEHKKNVYKNVGVATEKKVVTFRNVPQVIPATREPSDILSPSRYLLQSQKYYNELFMDSYTPTHQLLEDSASEDTGYKPRSIFETKPSPIHRSNIGHRKKAARTKRLDQTYSPLYSNSPFFRKETIWASEVKINKQCAIERHAMMQRMRLNSRNQTRKPRQARRKARNNNKPELRQKMGKVNLCRPFRSSGALSLTTEYNGPTNSISMT